MSLKSVYIINNDTVTIRSNNGFNASPSLPVGVYTMCMSADGEMYMTRTNDFMSIGKVYGDCSANKDTIINTFLDRSDKEKNTGVLLSGMKGTGKTLLIKEVVRELVDRYNIPVVLVNDAFNISRLQNMLERLDCRCAIVFDEFDKLYAADDETRQDMQAGLLTLLDGTIGSSKLFLFSANEQSRVSEWLVDRPGRIYYHFKFDTIPVSVIRDYCADNLYDQNYVDDIIRYMTYADTPSFDILACLVEECNRCKCSPAEFVYRLNINFSKNGTYAVEVVYPKTGAVFKSLAYEVDFDNRLSPSVQVRIPLTKDFFDAFGFDKDDLTPMDGGRVYLYGNPRVSISAAVANKAEEGKDDIYTEELSVTFAICDNTYIGTDEDGCICYYPSSNKQLLTKDCMLRMKKLPTSIKHIQHCSNVIPLQGIGNTSASIYDTIDY